MKLVFAVIKPGHEHVYNTHSYGPYQALSAVPSVIREPSLQAHYDLFEVEANLIN